MLVKCRDKLVTMIARVLQVVRVGSNVPNVTNIRVARASQPYPPGIRFGFTLADAASQTFKSPATGLPESRPPPPARPFRIFRQLGYIRRRVSGFRHLRSAHFRTFLRANRPASCREAPQLQSLGTAEARRSQGHQVFPGEAARPDKVQGRMA